MRIHCLSETNIDFDFSPSLMYNDIGKTQKTKKKEVKLKIMRKHKGGDTHEDNILNRFNIRICFSSVLL